MLWVIGCAFEGGFSPFFKGSDTQQGVQQSATGDGAGAPFAVPRW